MHMRTRVFPTQASLASQALQEPIYTVNWVNAECTMSNIAWHWKLLAIVRQHSSKEPQGTLCAKNGSTNKIILSMQHKYKEGKTSCSDVEQEIDL